MINIFSGGVFITWRQKDPKEGDLGLYGKKNVYSKHTDVIDSNDIYLVDIREEMKHETNQENFVAKAKFKRPHIAHNKTVLNSMWTHELSKLLDDWLSRCHTHTPFSDCPL